MAKSHANYDKLVFFLEASTSISVFSTRFYFSDVSTSISIFDLIGELKKGIDYAMGINSHTEYSFEILCKHQV